MHSQKAQDLSFTKVRVSIKILRGRFPWDTQSPLLKLNYLGVKMSPKNKAKKFVAVTKETGNLAKIFEILGSKTRLKILKIIANEEKCVNFLSKKLKLSQPTVSYHLKLLLGFGLVKQRKRAQWVQYILNREKLTELMANFSRLYGVLKTQKRRGKLLINKN